MKYINFRLAYKNITQVLPKLNAPVSESQTLTINTFLNTLGTDCKACGYPTKKGGECTIIIQSHHAYCHQHIKIVNRSIQEPLDMEKVVATCKSFVNRSIQEPLDMEKVVATCKSFVNRSIQEPLDMEKVVKLQTQSFTLTPLVDKRKIGKIPSIRARISDNGRKLYLKHVPKALLPNDILGTFNHLEITHNDPEKLVSSINLRYNKKAFEDGIISKKQFLAIIRGETDLKKVIVGNFHPEINKLNDNEQALYMDLITAYQFMDVISLDVDLKSSIIEYTKTFFGELPLPPEEHALQLNKINVQQFLAIIRGETDLETVMASKKRG